MARPFYEKAIECAKFLMDDSDIANYVNNLAALLKSQGKFLEAEPLYREAITIGEKNSWT